MARALGRDHEHVHVGARFDQAEVHVETMGEGQRGAFAHVVLQVVVVEVGLTFVRGQDHDEIRPLGRVGGGHDLEAVAFRRLGAGRAGAERHGDFLDARIPQVQRMGVALAAVADDGHLLGFHQVHVGIAIVIDTHF